MYKIFEDLKIHKVLDVEMDTRKSEIADLSKNQLRHECESREIPTMGKKVALLKIGISY